jgi:oligopeptide/dipeptide ABC transporter ATP-binding protein
VLRVRGLETLFETPLGPVRAVAGVDLTVRRGEVVCLVGESGSGKSVTAFSVMRLIEEPGTVSADAIEFAGHDLLSLPEAEMNRLRGRELSIIFQEPMTALNPSRRVGEQIAEVLRIHTQAAPREAWDRAVELLDRLGIANAPERARAYPHEMSGGQRQRVMIAIACACSPTLLIADEPTTALDVTVQAQILDLLLEVRARLGSAMLFITHDLGVVAEIADRVVVMYAGQVVEEGPVLDLFAAPRHPYTAALLAAVPDIDQPRDPARAFPVLDGTVPNPFDLPQGCRFRPRCPHAHARCMDAPPMVDLGPERGARCWLHVP